MNELAMKHYFFEDDQLYLYAHSHNIPIDRYIINDIRKTSIHRTFDIYGERLTCTKIEQSKSNQQVSYSVC